MHLFRRHIKKIIVMVAGIAFFPFLFLFAYDIGINERQLATLKHDVRGYSHPHDSRHIQTISVITNPGLMSNHCGFIVLEIRESELTPQEIHHAYASILTSDDLGARPPYRTVSLMYFNDVADAASFKENLELIDVRIPDAFKNTNHAYAILTVVTTSPNSDPRCH